MISLDTETCGIDFYHGAKPFFVTTCDEDGQQKFWEWDVDPMTREPEILAEDTREIRQLLAVQHSGIVLQNAKFDATALKAGEISDWSPLWELTHDTLLAGHLLGSNLPHDLTSMAMQYLGVDILPLEKRLEVAVKEARNIVRRDYPRWQIAKKGNPSMPSAKEEAWKFDTWLPKALLKQWRYEHEKGARLDGVEDGHPWETVLAEYANTDSAITIQLWLVMRAELEQKGLSEKYEAKRTTLPILYEMEQHGVVVSVEELNLLRDEYVAEKAKMTATCEQIASYFGYDLTLPKAGNNKSLTEFAFNILRLPVIKRSEKTGEPSLDKDVLAEYRLTLDGEQLEFVKALLGSRKRAKSIEYLDAYEKHGRPADEFGEYLCLHSHTNPTGTQTTRISMSNPNLQQCSKQETECEECEGTGCEACGETGEDLHSVRRIFTPAEGRELWTMDAANIELRIPAYKSGQLELIALFEKPNEPPFYGSQHLLNFSIVYEDVWEKELGAVGIDKVGPHCKKKYAAAEYQWCKNGDFALQYQCGDETGDRAFHRKGACRVLRSTFSALTELNAQTVAFADRHGYVLTLGGYPLLCTRGNWGKVVPTVPLNYLVQGTAGEWMTSAMTRCYRQILAWRREGFKAWMPLTVHDELMFDFPRGRGARPWETNLPKIRRLQQLMEQGGKDIDVPTPVSVEYHDECWAKGRSLSILLAA